METATPIFDQIMAEQGHEMMPMPPHRTHEEFMADHKRNFKVSDKQAPEKQGKKRGNTQSK